MTFNSHWHKYLQVRIKGGQVNKLDSGKNRKQTPRIESLHVIQNSFTGFYKKFLVLLRKHFYLLFYLHGYNRVRIHHSRQLYNIKAKKKECLHSNDEEIWKIEY